MGKSVAPGRKLITLIVTKDELAMINRLASDAGMSRSHYMRQASLKGRKPKTRIGLVRPVERDARSV